MPPIPLAITGVPVSQASWIVIGEFSYQTDGTTRTSISAYTSDSLALSKRPRKRTLPAPSFASRRSSAWWSSSSGRKSPWTFRTAGTPASRAIARTIVSPPLYQTSDPTKPKRTRPSGSGTFSRARTWSVRIPLSE